MSTRTSVLCIALLVACVGVCKWHHKMDVDSYNMVIESDLYVMQVLVERIEERDHYINKLENFIRQNWESDDEPTTTGQDFRPVDSSVQPDAPGGSS